jgi:hypothetical protein
LKYAYSIAAILAMFALLGLSAVLSSASAAPPSRCARCWHVTPGETYPAQFNDNDIGQVVKMQCTIVSNDQKGHIMTSCVEQ